MIFRLGLGDAIILGLARHGVAAFLGGGVVRVLLGIGRFRLRNHGVALRLGVRLGLVVGCFRVLLADVLVVAGHALAMLLGGLVVGLGLGHGRTVFGLGFLLGRALVNSRVAHVGGEGQHRGDTHHLQ